jgi:hypothetical protein
VELYFLFLALAALFIGACHLPIGGGAAAEPGVNRRPYGMFSAVAAVVCAAIAVLLVIIPLFD